MITQTIKTGAFEPERDGFAVTANANINSAGLGGDPGAR
jgi:hypothetical protein